MFKSLIGKFFTFLIIFQLSLFAAQLHAASAKDVSLNQGWSFKRISGNEVDKTAIKVNLPHTPKVEPLIVNDQWQGTSEYIKVIQFDPEWQDKALYIRFEAAMNHAEVWLNGTKLGEHLGGYLPFTFDVTNLLNSQSANTLKVVLHNVDNPIIGPKPLKILDFNTYGGLYRDVNLLVRNKVHITDPILANTAASGGIFVTFPEVSKSRSIVSVKTHLTNRLESNQDVSVTQSLYYNHKLITSNTQQHILLAANKNRQIEQQLDVTSALLWSPKTPHLYELQTDVFVADRLIESKTTRVGIRKFEFDAQHQLLINGEKTFLRGVNRHQEYPYVGYATSKQADYRDAVKIKSAGFDYVRLSHYPHSPAFMDAADELGLVLVNAVLGWQYYLESPEFKTQIINTCADLIRRDRNHASVLAWECSLNESAMPKSFVKDLHDTVHQEYPGAFSAGWQHGYDLYLQARQHRLRHYETPTQPYNVSEYGDWEYYAQNAGLNQDAWGNLKKEERTSRQLLSAGESRLLQQARNLQEAHNDNLANTPAFSDGYWVMFDYNRGYTDDLEASGIMSIFRVPKYSYYFYQSQRDPDYFVKDQGFAEYDAGPMVFIASEWRKSSSPKVRVFSNTDTVELWLNGKLLATKKPTKNKYSTHLPHPPFEFNLDQFKAGTLIAKGFINGKEVTRHRVSTPGKATGVELTLDISGQEMAKNGQDLVFVYAQLIDDSGNPVPLNNQEVTFNTVGDIEIVGQETSLTEQGVATILLRIGNSLKGAAVEVSADKLGIESAIFRLAHLAEQE